MHVFVAARGLGCQKDFDQAAISRRDNLRDGRAQEVEVGLPWEPIDAAIDALGHRLAVITVEEVLDQKGDLCLWA